jgi:hypothetical protein
MRPADDIKRFIDKAAVRTNPRMDKIILDRVLTAQEKATSEDSAALGPGRRSIIMKRPIVKLAAAAAVIAVVGLGIVEFLGSAGKSGIVWAEVVQKVQTSRGLIYRQRGETADDYVITYLSPTQYRSDSYKEGKLWITMWDNRETAKRVVLLHFQKGYVLEDMVMREEDSRNHANYQDPRWWVQKFLACKYSKLEPREIDGTLCEGIETTDTAILEGSGSSGNALVARLWVNIETGYPVLFEGELNGPEKKYTVFDQFQWDMAIDPGVFEPKIPPDYEQM